MGTAFDLPDEEQNAIGRAMLASALQVFRAPSGNPDDPDDQDEIARRTVRALAAAVEVKQAETLRLSESKGGRVHVETEAHEAVATAFWLWSEQVEIDLSEVCARSVASLRLLGLAQGLAAAAAVTTAMDMLVGGSEFYFVSDGALHLLARE